MRTNSKIRFGVMALAAALLLFLIWRLFLRPSAPSEEAAGDRNPNATSGNTVQVAAPQNMAAVSIGAIPDRSIVTSDMFKMVRLPAGASADNYVTDPTVVQGFITSRALPAGARLQRADLLGHITQIGVAGAVRPGLRAQVIPIANKATLHDLIHIGDYVDVIASFDQQESRAIVQNVRVLAVDVYGKDFPQVRIAARGPNRAEAPGVAGVPTPTPTPTPANGAPPVNPEASVTLEVTPQQAANLALAQAAASPLDLILRPRPTVTEVVAGISGATGVPVAVPVVGAIRARLAPYAERYKRNPQGGSANRPAANASTRSANTRVAERETTRQVSRDYSPAPMFPSSGSGGGIAPAGIPNGFSGAAAQPAPPSTYKIPIYGDGKMMREDEVLKPAN